ncbi:MAG: peptidylprolyl isomerase [Blastocatellia bacterium]
MKQNIRIAFALGLVWLVVQTVAVAQTIPPTLHARIIQLEDERNLNGDELTKLLKHVSPKIRERAALAIGRIGDKRGAAALIELLQTEKDEQVRAMTAFALGEIEDAAAVPALLAFLEPGKYPISVRARPVEALGKIASVPANIELLGKATLEQINARLIEQLPKPEFTLTEDKRLTASLAITALMRVRSTTSVEPLTHQLKSVEADNRALAANALARIRLPIASAVPALLGALNDSDHNVRANAARALGVSKDARAVEPLIKLLGDKSEQVQVSAIRALATIGDKRAVSPIKDFGEKMLNRYLQEEEPIGTKESMIAEIATALGTLKDEAAIPVLRQFRSFRGIGFFPEVEIAIARISETAFHELTLGGGGGLLREPWKDVAAYAQGLGEIKSEEAKEKLLLLAGMTEAKDFSKAKPEVLRGLVKQKPKTLNMLLKDALVGGDLITSATAASLLTGFQDDENFNSLTEKLKERANDKENDAKLAILTALSKYKSEKAIEAIKTTLNDSDHLVRRRAVDLLKQSGAGDFSDHIGIVKTGHDKLFYQRVAARMNKKVTATLHTDKGAIRMELFPAEAPITVDSFVMLARKGYFNDLTFHRVVPNFVIQGGDPQGTGEGGPGYQIRCEVNTRPYIRGAVGMALSGKDTGGSQFFITHSPQPHLDGGYTVFGQVTSGLDVVDRIVRGDVIKRIQIVER